MHWVSIWTKHIKVENDAFRTPHVSNTYEKTYHEKRGASLYETCIWRSRIAMWLSPQMTESELLIFATCFFYFYFWCAIFEILLFFKLFFCWEVSGQKKGKKNTWEGHGGKKGNKSIFRGNFLLYGENPIKKSKKNQFSGLFSFPRRKSGEKK